LVEGRLVDGIAEGLDSGVRLVIPLSGQDPVKIRSKSGQGPVEIIMEGHGNNRENQGGSIFESIAS